MLMKQHCQLVAMVGSSTFPHCASIPWFQPEWAKLGRSGQFQHKKQKPTADVTGNGSMEGHATYAAPRQGLRGIVTNTGKVSGSGLNLKQRRAKFWKQEAEFIDSCLECIQEGDMEKELEMEMNPDEFFPNKRAEHKVPENIDSSNVVQKRKASNENNKKNEAKKQKTTNNAITSKKKRRQRHQKEK